MARTRYNFWIDEEQRDGLRLLAERDGVLESESIRRAIKAWLITKRVKVKATASKRAATRQRATR